MGEDEGNKQTQTREEVSTCREAKIGKRFFLIQIFIPLATHMGT